MARARMILCPRLAIQQLGNRRSNHVIQSLSHFASVLMIFGCLALIKAFAASAVDTAPNSLPGAMIYMLGQREITHWLGWPSSRFSCITCSGVRSSLSTFVIATMASRLLAVRLGT